MGENYRETPGLVNCEEGEFLIEDKDLVESRVATN